MKKFLLGAGVLILVALTAMIAVWIKDLYPKVIQLGGTTLYPTRVVNLIGTGNAYRKPDNWNVPCGFIATSTMYQFASTTIVGGGVPAAGVPACFNLEEHPFKQYGATATAIFVTDGARNVTLFGQYKSNDHNNALPKLYCDVWASVDSNCGMASSTQNLANWYGVPSSTVDFYNSVLNTTPGFSVGTTTPISLVSGGNSASKFFTYPFMNVNYKCMKVSCYNNSTTDDSLLWLQAALGE